MKQYWILLYAVVIAMVGCKQEKAEEKSGYSSGTVAETKPDTETDRILPNKIFSNPVFIGGNTDFLSYLGAIKATTGDLNTLLKFTSDESIKHLKISGVRSWWANHNINCQKKLKSVVKKSEKSYLMTYEILVNATRKIIQVEVRVENDSCRFVIPTKSEWFPEQEK